MGLVRRALKAGITMSGAPIALGIIRRIRRNSSEPAGAGPLIALIDALERRRSLFWTGKVLVEFDPDFIPFGPVTMVLDEHDADMLFALKAILSGSTPVRNTTVKLNSVSTLDTLGGLTWEEAESLAARNLDEAADFRELANDDPNGPWVGFADWKKRRARIFKQLAAEESQAQSQYERQRDAEQERNTHD